jgi:hypothetical protein
VTDAENQKTCFVIAPIGGRESDVRRRSDQVFNHIIKPVTSKLGYRQPPERADKISAPGIITDQIIDHLLDDDLVVADLSGRNANVFYELAIRHALRKPVVIMISEGEDIPFDVSQSRAIQFDYRDLDSVANCKEELENQILSLEESPNSVFSPISNAVDLRTMRESGDPSARRDAQMLSAIQALQADVSRLERRVDTYSATEHRPARPRRSPLRELDTHEDNALSMVDVVNFFRTLAKVSDQPPRDHDAENSNEE